MVPRLAAYRATGARVQSTHFLVLLAQALAGCGRHGEGLGALCEAAALAEEMGERYVEAEIHRVQGNLLLAQGGNDTAEAEAPVTCGHWRWRGRRRRAHSNCALPAISPACGPSAASAPARRISWRRSMVGSPKASTPPT